MSCRSNKIEWHASWSQTGNPNSWIKTNISPFVSFSYIPQTKSQFLKTYQVIHQVQHLIPREHHSQYPWCRRELVPQWSMRYNLNTESIMVVLPSKKQTKKLWFECTHIPSGCIYSRGTQIFLLMMRITCMHLHHRKWVAGNAHIIQSHHQLQACNKSSHHLSKNWVPLLLTNIPTHRKKNREVIFTFHVLPYIPTWNTA